MPAAKHTSLAVIGLGNIGSQVVPLIGALPGIERVLLVDFDRYEASNLGQRITPGDVGKAKATVQARWLRSMTPGLAVTAYTSRFEDLPVGLLRRTIILSCVDSRAARQSINRAAFALGTPWIDAALGREGSLRSRAYLPGHGSCLECSWGPHDYELLEQRLPCEVGVPKSAPTAAAAELGAIVAGIQIALCRRLKSDVSAIDALADRQWFLDLPSGRGWTSTYSINPECRLDHSPLNITDLGGGSIDMPLQDALTLGAVNAPQATLSAPGQVFVRCLRCSKCPQARRVRCRLSGRLARPQCVACGGPTLVAAMDSELALSAGNASAAELREPLGRRGFVVGDLISVAAGGVTHHYQLN